MLRDEERTEELRAMGDRVRLLSATIDALLGQMEDGAEAGGEPTTAPEPSKTKRPTTKRSSPSSSSTPRR
jgi:hypothetical protein